MDVQEIIKEYLEKNKYDGLFNLDTECGCELADLMPCAEPSPMCEAGYCQPCHCEEEHPFHIGLKPPKPKSRMRKILDCAAAILEACTKNGRCRILKRK